MNRNKKLIAIIPVRKNSKGIKNKNLLTIQKKTLLERKIILAKNNDYIDDIIVSTNCKKMFNIAKEYKVNEKNLRIKKLSSDKALTINVVKDVVKKNNLKDVFILLLQVTSPFSNQKLLNEFLRNFHKRKFYNSSISVTKFDNPHPYKIQIIKNKQLKSLLKKESMVPRQSLPQVYKLNGLFYLTHVDFILKKSSFFIEPILPNIVKKDFSLNLDEKEDLIIFDHYKKNKNLINYI